ncbi:hypothetical protein ABB37_09688 [Leptomonas pyrrhocoris]|uniref:Leucine-rich repeat protein n=1 Tax=Leptomonas pyrrhocoris TaxID=157538 RepID=A0A0M9FQF6_LEPPY|nr:hypothetical protein ABB37_09688 [Leptomonas pyrrhocoris]XP_015652249.1 hypothetical protein ABB37_09688 [Leptomonas pyrrhocoris]KPA73809.1 hypothetical protein ABB37_09688 [Leptomonas pyrrhocoris]KPA73810.1 hypothetical protein ABB37_09688 [Leptomonas pyrrhocoris]|eukprot:XP_015652248.1 hypothetical protein ABB37_09688 [Leptomonas pyrrhocoris]
MASALDASLTPSPPHSRRTADWLCVVRDVLIREEWFTERPPLALAFAHPLTRLYCEMWRTECFGDLEHVTTTAVSYHSGPPSKPSAGDDDDEVDGAPSPALFVSVGRLRVANPTALEDPPARGAAGITRPCPLSPAAVFDGSPFASSARRHVCSLVPPLTAAGALGAASPSRAGAFGLARRAPRRTPVVNPSAPLYSLETYREKVLKLPIGVQLGHARLITTPLPQLNPQDVGGSGGGDVQWVRGLFSHVPAAVTLSASQRAAAAISAAAMACDRTAAVAAAVREEGAYAGGPQCPFVESDNEGESSPSPREEDTVLHAEAPPSDVEEDWETAALQEEAQLTHAASHSSVEAAPTRPATIAHPSSKGTAESPPAQATKGPARASATTTGVPSTMSSDSAKAIWKESHNAFRLSAMSAVLDAATTVLPPPCGWWLRRPVIAATATADPCSHEALRLPLYAHCVEATKQWVDWLDDLQRPLHGNDGREKRFPVRHTVDLRGVSLTGWSTAYVPHTLVTPAELAQRVTALRIEEALPRTLPLRGLHLESTTSAMQALLHTGGASAAAAWHDSLVALDLPYLRDTDAGPVLGHADGPPHPLAVALHSLPHLRFLSLNCSKASWKDGVGSSENAWDADGEEMTQPLEELMLFGVTDVPARAFASLSRRCVFLRVVDLSSTNITEAELSALVFGRWDTDAAPNVRRTSPLVWLEELRLVACHSLARVRAVTALPRLRWLNLQASGVCQLEDLVGCDALEVVVLTRCAHVTSLYPLWHLPRLRCVEADNVRTLRHDDGLLRLPLPPASDHYGDAVVSAPTAVAAAVHGAEVAAPLCRLNLSQAAFIHGAAVAQLAAAPCDVSGCLRSLTVLLLDNTSVNDETVAALAGVTGAREMTGDSGGGGPAEPRSAAAAAAAGLREVSFAGCHGVHDLGPLGLLPHLTSVVADGAGVERVDGLQRSRTLSFLSLAHCSRLWSIAPLAFASTLRTLDVSRTPLNDAGLMRFVFPSLVDTVIAQQLHGAASPDTAFAGSPSSSSADVVPSQIEQLRLYQCTSLRYIGCLAHLPRLRRLDVSHAAVFDRGFVCFFASPAVLLRTQLWIPAAAGPAAATWADEEAGRTALRRDSEAAMAPMPDEASLLRAWRRGGSQQRPSRPHFNPPSLRFLSDATARRAATTECEAADGAGLSREDEFVLDVGAAATLTHLSFAYCAEVRGVAPCALFCALTSLDLTATAVDSAALLAFVNLLHECCRVEGEGEGNDATPMVLKMERDGLRACVDDDSGEGGAARQRAYALTSLSLSFCPYVTDVRCCATIPSLTHLTLYGTHVANPSMEAFAAPPALSPSSTASIVERRWWSRHQCALQSLDIRRCRDVTDVTPLLQTAALRELYVGHSGVTASRTELQALNPHSRCVFTL